MNSYKLAERAVLSEPSSHEANKVLRVLKGERLKYTVRVHKPDGETIEFQTDSLPIIKFFDEDRCLWLVAGNYGGGHIMKWIEGAILLTEENK